MRLPAELIRLPLRVDSRLLATEVTSLDETAWRPLAASSGAWVVPLVCVDGDPAETSAAGRLAPTAHLTSMPYLCQVLAAFGTEIGRTRLERIEGAAESRGQVETERHWQDNVAVHVPVVSQSIIRFRCGDRAAHLAAGEAWVFDTTIPHNFVNPGSGERIHLVTETTGSSEFWQLVAAGQMNPTTVGVGPHAVLDHGVAPALRFANTATAQLSPGRAT